MQGPGSMATYRVFKSCGRGRKIRLGYLVVDTGKPILLKMEVPLKGAFHLEKVRDCERQSERTVSKRVLRR